MKFLKKICYFLLVFAVFGVKNVKSFGFIPTWGYPFDTKMVDFYSAMNLFDQVLENKDINYDDRRALQTLFAAKLIKDLKFKGLRFWSYIYILELIDAIYRDYFEISEAEDAKKHEPEEVVPGVV